MLDLSGHQYGHLTVLDFHHRNARRIAHWRCRCACGQERVVSLGNLRSGNSTSCGCGHGFKIDDPITQAQLKRLVQYDPKTGKFHWLVDTRNCVAGIEAGHFNEANGYVRIAFKKRSYYAHLLAWLYMTGTWPVNEIDHIDTDGANNCWKNLREATHMENCWNTGLTARNNSGYKGVKQIGQHFSAWIRAQNVYYKLGVFPDAVSAAQAYDAAARRLHGRFARPNFEAGA